MKKYLSTIFLIVLLTSTTIAQHEGWFWQNPTWGGMGANDVCFVNETTGWLVSFLGTVMKTTDGGKNFFNVDLNTEVTFLGVCFVNPNVGYIFGAGGTFYKTTDAGTNWELKPNSIGQYLADAYFFDENTGWICGYNGTVVKTTDGGTTWQNSVTGSTKILNAIHFFDQNNGIVGGWNNTLLKTTNGGQTWLPIAPEGNNLFQSVYFASIDTLYAGGYGILRSTDGGISWVQQSTPAQFNAVALNFYNDTKTGVAVSDLGAVIKTTNAGENWITLLTGGSVIKRASFINTTHIFCAGSKGVYGTNFLSSTNSGQTWNDYSSILYFSFLGQPSVATKIFFLNKDRGYVTGDNEVWNTTDGGTTWTLTTVSANTTLYDINFYDENVGLTVGADNPSIFRTTDGGLNWLQIATPGRENLVWLSLPEYPVGYAFGDGILKTEDAGLSWSKLNVPDVGYFTGCFINKDTGWTAGVGFIKRTVDGGETWTDLFTGSGTFYSIVFATADTGWACGTGDVVGRTTDGGVTWIPVHTGAAGTMVTLNELSFINSKQCYVGGKYGYVGYTSDGGITWINQNARVGQAISSIFFLDSTTGWITGYGGFVKKTTTGAAPIPVELSSFNASLADDKVILNWITASENNNQGFEIERLQDYKTMPTARQVSGLQNFSDWQKIGFVPGYGTTADAKSYSFIDDISLLNTTADKFVYRLKQIDFDGTFKYSTEVSINVFTPLEFSLDQNYPNPFNPSTTIAYSIPALTSSSPGGERVSRFQSGHVRVSLIVYDVLGNEVASLVNEYKSAGKYNVEFNAANLSSGIYFYTLNAGNYRKTRKLVLLR